MLSPEYTPTREAQTETRYLKRAQGRFNAFFLDTGKDWDLYAEDFLAWLTVYRGTLSAAAWRQNRAALVWFLREVANRGELADRIKAISTEGCCEATRTSATKKKSLSERELSRITDALLRSHRKHMGSGGAYDDSIALQTLLLLLSGYLLGLRPSEWWDTEITETRIDGSQYVWDANDLEPIDADALLLEEPLDIDSLTVVVKNGKATNGRAHGSHRTLRIRGFSSKTYKALIGHYRFVKRCQSQAAYEDLQRRCTGRMHYTTRRLWRSRKTWPSLYSSRHQFSANLKKLEASLQEGAALMGHLSDRTATEHYGRKRAGRDFGHQIEAATDEVSRVRRVSKLGTPQGQPKPASP